MEGNTTSPQSEEYPRFAPPPPSPLPALVVLWSRRTPGAVGAFALLAEGRVNVVGRDLDFSPVQFCFAVPTGGVIMAPQLTASKTSRNHFELTKLSQPDAAAWLLTPKGTQLAVLVNGKRIASPTQVTCGDVIEIEGEYLFFLTLRRSPLGAEVPGVREHRFGEADANGIVGESYLAWLLRTAIARAAVAESHVLVLGPSGAGKEMTAAGVHAWSTRANGPFETINAATFSPALIALTLFGNVKNHPNPGTAASLGLVGSAEGGTLFVDEIGEASHDLHANMLRVLDPAGEYWRLGEERARRANVLVIAATNRDVSALKPDLPKRFPVHIEVPPLRERREDIPLIARQLVLGRARIEAKDERRQPFARRFIERASAPNERDEIRISPALVTELVRREHPLNVRDVEAMLVAAMMASPKTESGRDVIVAPHDLNAPLEESKSKERVATVKPKDPSKEELLVALRKHGGSLTEAGKDFGFNRFKVRRLMNELAITDDECRTQ